MPRSLSIPGSLVAAGRGGSADRGGSSPAGGVPTDRPRPGGTLKPDMHWLLGFAAVLVMIGWAYWPNLRSFWVIWSREPNYSHGFLVIPIALLLLWQRIQATRGECFVSRGPWWSWLVVAMVLALRALAYEWSSQWVENATIVLATASLLFALGGWPLLSAGWPAALFLLFMLPLPSAINNTLPLQLQNFATQGSVFVMQMLGILAIQDGNTIFLPDAPEASRVLEVARACNGLSMLMTLAAVVTATIFLLPISNWKRVVVLLSAIPIALLCNIVRIVGTGWCYLVFEGENAKKLAHDWSGFLLMMPLALVLVFLEILLLNWLEAPDEENDGNSLRPVLAVLPQTRLDQGKSKSNKDKIAFDE